MFRWSGLRDWVLFFIACLSGAAFSSASPSFCAFSAFSCAYAEGTPLISSGSSLASRSSVASRPSPPEAANSALGSCSIPWDA